MKELEALKRLLDHCGNTEDGYNECDIDIEDYETVKNALERNEKLEKVWKIVKEKEVNVCDLVYWADDVNGQLQGYNRTRESDWMELTEEEFDLLKEMLK